MPLVDLDPITFSEAKSAAEAGATLRMVLCIRDASGSFVSYLRFMGAPRWRLLKERKGKSARAWTSVDRILRRIKGIFGALVCCVVCPLDHPCLRKLGIILP